MIMFLFGLFSFRIRFLKMAVITLRGILDAKLGSNNFDDWYRNLRIVLMHEKLIDVIDKPAKVAPHEGEDDANILDTYAKYLEQSTTAKCIILASMTADLQRQHNDMNPPQIIEHLKKMYGSQSRTARYQLSKSLFESKLKSKEPVGLHVLKMIDLIEQLEKHGCTLGKELSQDLILQSLNDTYSPFIVNFNMNKMDCDLHELLNLLIDFEKQITSGKVNVSGSVNLVGSSSKSKWKGKKRSKKNPLAPKDVVNKSKGKKVQLDQSGYRMFLL
ncbi:uncharacterized protein LOC141658407 [Silene latifolia]|uniref:uncharacterized protein LOC141658407 n=1 Tax=Silene latifolia TaxID=37657 RepID=UPI003D76AFB1